MGPELLGKNVPLNSSVESRPTSSTAPSSLPILPELFFTCGLWVAWNRKRKLLVYYCMRLGENATILLVILHNLPFIYNNLILLTA